MTTSTDTSSINDSDVAGRFRVLADRFASVLDTALPSAWDAPSPCEGWTARDVVGHVIESQRDFFARHDIDLGGMPDLDDPAAAWHAHASVVEERLADPAVGGKAFDGHFGPTTIGDTILSFYGFDLVAHRWDVATAVGVDLRFTDDELEFMETAADGFGAALYSDGVCRSGVEAPEGSDRQTRLLARLGRTS